MKSKEAGAVSHACLLRFNLNVYLMVNDQMPLQALV